MQYRYFIYFWQTSNFCGQGFEMYIRAGIDGQIGERVIKVKLKFLGTAAAEGWPAVFCQCQACRKAKEIGEKNIRTRSSVLIDDKYLVDFPPDTYIHTLKEGIDLGQVEHLLITHSHQDHFYPQELAMRGKPYAHLQAEQKLQVWGNEVVTDLIKAGDYDTVFAHKVHPGKVFNAGELEITALQAEHMKSEDALLYIIKKNEQSIFYGHDSGWYPEETWKQLENRDLDCVIFDCTYGPLDGGGHMGIPTILKAKEKLFEIGAISEKSILVITHFSHNGGYLHEDLAVHVADDGLIVAYDGMLLEIGI